MNVLWLQSGGCGGCSMSLLCADTADFPAMLKSGGIDLLWHPSLSLASGRELIALLEDCRDGRTQLDVLCVEGSLLRGPNGTGRFHVLAGTGLPMIDWVRSLAAAATHVVAVGSCAACASGGAGVAIGVALALAIASDFDAVLRAWRSYHERHGQGYFTLDLGFLSAIARAGVDADVVATPQAKAAYTACLKRYRTSTQLWNRSRISLGVAGGNGHEQGGEKRKVNYGRATWLTVQYGFEGLDKLGGALVGTTYVDCANAPKPSGAGGGCTPVEDSHWRDRSLLTLHARHIRDATDLDLSQQGPLARVSSRLYGARFTYGSERRNFFVELSRATDHHALNGSSSTRLRAFGASFKVMDNLWLNVVSGKRREMAANGTAHVVQVDLAYGLSQDPLVPSP